MARNTLYTTSSTILKVIGGIWYKRAWLFASSFIHVKQHISFTFAPCYVHCTRMTYHITTNPWYMNENDTVIIDECHHFIKDQAIVGLCMHEKSITHNSLIKDIHPINQDHAASPNTFIFLCEHWYSHANNPKIKVMLSRILLLPHISSFFYNSWIACSSAGAYHSGYYFSGLGLTRSFLWSFLVLHYHPDLIVTVVIVILDSCDNVKANQNTCWSHIGIHDGCYFLQSLHWQHGEAHQTGMKPCEWREISRRWSVPRGVQIRARA